MISKRAIYSKVISPRSIRINKNPNLENDIIQNKINEAKNTDNQLISVDDNITLKYHYVESSVGFKQGDRYMIEIISKNYN